MALANQGFTLRHFPGRQHEALQSLRRYRQLLGRDGTDQMSRLVVFTIHEIEAEMTNKQAAASSAHSLRACMCPPIASSRHFNEQEGLNTDERARFRMRGRGAHG